MREKIKILIEKYEKIKNSGILKSYTEEETKKDFILPFFKALGWKIDEKNEVSAEETISSGRVDYGFYLDGRIKFYVETKKFNINIHEERFADQAIRYSFNRGATWAILTNFETLIIFNAQDINRKLSDKRFFEINYNEYLKRFDQINLLSKLSFQKNLLDKEAEKVGKKIQKISVTSLLYEDLQNCRDILLKRLRQWNEKIDPELLEEGVQKLLDRLIFIRVTEDRGIEPLTLIPMIREWNSRKNNDKHIYQTMIKKFREFDQFYNSNLFSKHPFEDWEEYSGATEKVIKILYGKEGYYQYDFKVMPSDVLGTVYENYLSHRLLKSNIDTNISKDSKKKKEEGIYYTPDSIVSYIVKNALEPILQKCKTIEDIKSLKILDPACGSGSFLIKALEVIFNRYKDFNSSMSEDLLKIQILKDNIYGVDLDPQAVEITRLNLLINAVEKRQKLPLLKNIKNGNSLISGTDTELKKYFGKKFQDKKPFNWREEFPEVFKKGGFDVIIGNPPWVSIKGKQKSADFGKNELKYFSEVLHADTFRPNLFEMFIWKSLSLLNPLGTLGFIVPDRLSSNAQFKKLRKYILSNCSIRVLLYGVDFPGIISDVLIFILSKEINRKNLVKVQTLPSTVPELVPQQYFKEKPSKELTYSSNINDRLLKKILRSSYALEKLLHTSVGFIAKRNLLTKERKSDSQIIVLKGENILRYYTKGNYFFDFIKTNLAGGTQDQEKLKFSPKILMRKTGLNLIATFDETGFYPEQSLYFIYGADKDTILSVLAIINSKLMNWYYQNFVITNKKSTPQLKKIHLDKFPIVNLSQVGKKRLSLLTAKIIELKKRLYTVKENSDQWRDLESNIKKIDIKIDEEVYKIYGLTSKEVEVIEKSSYSK